MPEVQKKGRDYKLEDFAGVAARHEVMDSYFLHQYISWIRQWYVTSIDPRPRPEETAEEYARIHMSRNGYTYRDIDKCEKLYHAIKKIVDTTKEKGLKFVQPR